jgi:hypothetical protein
MRVLLGQDLERPRKFAAGRLKCDDPRVSNNYLKHYEQFIKKSQLRVRSRALAQDDHDLGLAKEQSQEYEQLDVL